MNSFWSRNPSRRRKLDFSFLMECLQSRMRVGCLHFYRVCAEPRLELSMRFIVIIDNSLCFRHLSEILNSAENNFQSNPTAQTRQDRDDLNQIPRTIPLEKSFLTHRHHHLVFVCFPISGRRVDEPYWQNLDSQDCQTLSCHIVWFKKKIENSDRHRSVLTTLHPTHQHKG